MIQNPIVVHVVQQPVKSTTVADVLVGAIGLTGMLILVAALLGALFGAVLIGVKLLRRRLNIEPPESDIIPLIRDSRFAPRDSPFAVRDSDSRLAIHD